MGGKSSPSSGVSDSLLAAIYNSDINSSQLSAQTSQDQLNWAKQQYNQEWPYVQNYMSAMTNTMNAENQAGQNAQQYYYSTYQPIETQYAQQAMGYNTPQRAAQASAAAQADVAASYQGQRTAALQGLESYGIDPSQTRYGALDLGARISQAAAQASAGTQSRLQTEATGLGLEAQAINTGRGYASNIAQAYQTGTQAGGAGVSAANQSTSTASQSMGTPTQWGALSTSALTGASNAVNSAFSNELASWNASTSASQNEWGGIGSLVGGLGMAAII